MSRKRPNDHLAPSEVLYRPDMAANYTGYSRQTMAQWRYLGKGPRYLRPTPRTIIYRKSDLDAWLSASVVDPAAS
ncbi:putative DNA-binding transcriptional regulator AlpA [Arthrobacter sp. V4I6]|uniref:helix-turn-helix transcriptional regulator n=1 Tax=unclassified Arthrobacter TaxID=235627 RepID=UPI00278A68AF|nr:MULTISPECIES: helix-turn-helix domain-containing protein [unclassified Arthrobacter]MDQ0822792.1 putative DNA-binding transcriptional regulator AlpA [Arthrobacter sp. V1I7]MDQ0852421.1 putative DNA-binding transcriptional regulator AlpA [Arthrobacter sp. V4I6]